MLWILHSDTVQDFISAYCAYIGSVSSPQSVILSPSFVLRFSSCLTYICRSSPESSLSLSLLVLSSLDLDYRRTSLSMSLHPPQSHFLPQLFQSHLCYRTPSNSPSAPPISGSTFYHSSSNYDYTPHYVGYVWSYSRDPNCNKTALCHRYFVNVTLPGLTFVDVRTKGTADHGLEDAKAT